MKSQRISLRATANELRNGTFVMPADEITEPVMELTFWTDVQGENMQTRTRVTREFMAAAPDWKRYTGNEVLKSVGKAIASNA